ncbi:MAG: helix-turn-helix domain-containing protein [Proteobacteria bacterium]|nr:helix-turn-helix domain-containing protein [Pseudomonadota bacterium]
MVRRLIKSMKEAVAYAKGDTSKGCKKDIVEPVQIPEEIDLKALRARLHMSQAEFAARYGFNLNTLRNWEHKRRYPDRAVLAYLLAISKAPDLIERTLHS